MATVMGYANHTSFFNAGKGAKRTAVFFKNVKQGNLLSIKDSNGMTLYKELIEKAGVYSKGFDLTALPNGHYIFELDKDLEIRTIPFTVTLNNVVFNKVKEKVIFKPHTRVKDHLVLISRLSLNKAPLDIKIYYDGDHTYELIHSENIENTKIVERTYRLSKKGAYKIVFYSEDRMFTEYFNN